MYVALVGFVTFPLFILEESIQMATWGTWAAKEAKDYNLQLQGVIVIERLNTVMQTINNSLGWVQPLSMLGYDGYAQATDVYIKSMKAKILAHEPEVFLDRELEFKFAPKEIKIMPDGRYLLINGKISVIMESVPETATIHVKGVMRNKNGSMTIIAN